jgi:hypothetical protein
LDTMITVSSSPDYKAEEKEEEQEEEKRKHG